LRRGYGAGPMETGRKELWGFKKTAMVVVPLSLVAALIVFAYLPRDEKLKVSAAKGGECIQMPESTVTKLLRKRDCDQTHTGEIFAAFDNYPAQPAPDQPTPEENCLRLPEKLTPDEATLYQKALDRLLLSGHELVVIANNEPGYERDVACVIAFAEPRVGSYLQELAVTLGPLPTTVPQG
jgi:hypothetical protein